MNGLATRQALESIADQCAPGTQAPPLQGFEPFDLGTPREAERRRAAKRERIYRGACKVAIWVVLLLCGAAIGHHSRSIQPEPIIGAEYRTKAARMALATRDCAFDFREGCLVCVRKDSNGAISRMTHC